MGNKAALSGCSLGGSDSHLGPTGPKSMASASLQAESVVSGRAEPWLSMPIPPTSCSVVSMAKPFRF